MKRLHEHQLIYGRLLLVDEPHMVARYNDALVNFGFEPVALKSFEIDKMGFSPQVANALGDQNYLDPHDVNRRFIILSPDQALLPVVQTAFSNTETLMKLFYKENARAISTITIKDVLFGEIEDSVFRVNRLEDLLSIEQVEFKLNTADDLIGQANELRTLSDRLLKEPDAWRDDELISKMVELAKLCGDIRKNKMVPSQVVFRHNTYWTSHFGGLYVFIDEKATTVIGDPKAEGFKKTRPWQVNYIDINDADAVYRFLLDSERIELPRGSWVERCGLIEHRIEMLTAWLASWSDPKLEIIADDKKWRNHWLNANQELVEDDGTLEFFKWAEQELANWSQIDLESVDAPALFLLSRAEPKHADCALVNRLISEFVPFDCVHRFVHNKPAFYNDYEAWGEPYRAYVVKCITNTYFKNKKTYRKRFFGN